MKLNAGKFAKAAAVVMGIWYVVCATLVSIAPVMASTLFGMMVHMVNLDQFVAMRLTIGSLTIGFLEAVLLAYITGWGFATAYNKFVKEK